MHPRAAAANQSCEGRLPVRVTVRSRVSWRLRVPPTAAPPPAPINAPSRRRPPPPRYDGRGDDVCRGECACRPPLPHPRRLSTLHRAAGHRRRGTMDEATTCVVAAARTARRCPTPRAHQRPVEQPTTTAAVRRTRRSRVLWRMRVPPTAAPPPAPTNIPSRRRPSRSRMRRTWQSRSRASFMQGTPASTRMLPSRPPRFCKFLITTTLE